MHELPPHEPPRDELLSAYLDGELNANERARVEHWLADSAEFRNALDELRAVGAGLRALPRHRLEADFSQRVLRRAERQMLAEPLAPAEPRLPTEPLAPAAGDPPMGVTLPDATVPAATVPAATAAADEHRRDADSTLGRHVALPGASRPLGQSASSDIGVAGQRRPMKFAAWATAALALAAALLVAVNPFGWNSPRQLATVDERAKQNEFAFTNSQSAPGSTAPGSTAAVRGGAIVFSEESGPDASNLAGADRSGRFQRHAGDGPLDIASSNGVATFGANGRGGMGGGEKVAGGMGGGGDRYYYVEAREAPVMLSLEISDDDYRNGAIENLFAQADIPFLDEAHESSLPDAAWGEEDEAELRRSDAGALTAAGIDKRDASPEGESIARDAPRQAVDSGSEPPASDSDGEQAAAVDDAKAYAKGVAPSTYELAYEVVATPEQLDRLASAVGPDVKWYYREVSESPGTQPGQSSLERLAEHDGAQAADKHLPGEASLPVPPAPTPAPSGPEDPAPRAVNESASTERPSSKFRVPGAAPPKPAARGPAASDQDRQEEAVPAPAPGAASRPSSRASSVEGQRGKAAAGDTIRARGSVERRSINADEMPAESPARKKQPSRTPAEEKQSGSGQADTTPTDDTRDDAPPSKGPAGRGLGGHQGKSEAAPTEGHPGRESAGLGQTAEEGRQNAARSGYRRLRVLLREEALFGEGERPLSGRSSGSGQDWEADPIATDPADMPADGADEADGIADDRFDAEVPLPAEPPAPPMPPAPAEVEVQPLAGTTAPVELYELPVREDVSSPENRPGLADLSDSPDMPQRDDLQRHKMELDGLEPDNLTHMAKDQSDWTKGPVDALSATAGEQLPWADADSIKESRQRQLSESPDRRQGVVRAIVVIKVVPSPVAAGREAADDMLPATESEAQTRPAQPAAPANPD